MEIMFDLKILYCYAVWNLEIMFDLKILYYYAVWNIRNAFFQHDVTEYTRGHQKVNKGPFIINCLGGQQIGRDNTLKKCDPPTAIP